MSGSVGWCHQHPSDTNSFHPACEQSRTGRGETLLRSCLFLSGQGFPAAACGVLPTYGVFHTLALSEFKFCSYWNQIESRGWDLCRARRGQVSLCTWQWDMGSGYSQGFRQRWKCQTVSLKGKGKRACIRLEACNELVASTTTECRRKILDLAPKECGAVNVDWQ